MFEVFSIFVCLSLEASRLLIVVDFGKSLDVITACEKPLLQVVVFVFEHFICSVLRLI